jgi:hypothetical protein
LLTDNHGPKNQQLCDPDRGVDEPIPSRNGARFVFCGLKTGNHAMRSKQRAPSVGIAGFRVKVVCLAAGPAQETFRPISCGKMALPFLKYTLLPIKPIGRKLVHCLTRYGARRLYQLFE